MPRKPAVWSSTLTHNTRNSKPFGFDLPPGKDAFFRCYKERKSTVSKDAPISVHLLGKDLKDSDIQKIPDAFRGVGRVLIISPGFHDLLQKFDLGPTQFFDVPLYEYDRTTLRPERYFVMQVNAVKDAVVPEVSDTFRVSSDGTMRPYSSSPVDFTVTPAALEGPDLWWDSKVKERLFFSDRLKRAIKDNRIHASVWGWKKCRILD